MASYTVPAGHVGAHVKTLVADTVDTVTFTGADLTYVEILSDGTADIYLTLGGAAPTVAGSQCHRVPASGAETAKYLSVRTSGDTVVKLISAGTPVYSVSRT